MGTISSSFGRGQVEPLVGGTTFLRFLLDEIFFRTENPGVLDAARKPGRRYEDVASDQTSLSQVE